MHESQSFFPPYCLHGFTSSEGFLHLQLYFSSHFIPLHSLSFRTSLTHSDYFLHKVSRIAHIVEEEEAVFECMCGSSTFTESAERTVSRCDTTKGQTIDLVTGQHFRI